MRFAKTRNTTRLKCCACHEKWRWTRPKCCACHENCNTSTENVAKICACHAKRLSTRCRTRLNVMKCHACHAKRSNDTLETSKNDHLCRTSHRHGHTEFVRTVANGCERLRTVATTNATSNTPSTPRPPEWNGNPCYAFGKNYGKLWKIMEKWWKNDGKNDGNMGLMGIMVEIIGTCGDFGTGKMELEATKATWFLLIWGFVQESLRMDRTWGSSVWQDLFLLVAM